MKKKLIWAIDPYEKNSNPSRALLAKLVAWAKAGEAEVQPVYIISIAPDAPGSESFSPDIAREEKNANEYLQKLGIEGMASTKVLTLKAADRAEEVKLLHSYALENGSDSILISSHGRSGLGRLLFGSFAESLLLISTLPIFFLSNREAEPQRERFERLLFITDFSPRSKAIFQAFLKLVKSRGVGIDLFHVVSLPATALLSSQETQVVVSENFFTEQLDWAKEEARSWKELAKAENLELQFEAVDNGIGADIAELIQRRAMEKKIDFIVMSSASSTLSSLVVGSLSQSLFRRNTFSSLVYGPKV